ncbi:MAG: c-type cytochrome [Lentisphaeria bacterium]|jgi:cytochrome c553|nr:c-type cytochrome [Lentisphaeria bacterium]MDP7742911.1 c-type cytochrome [Lentisphaeria bacterium]
MKELLKIALFTICVTSFYMYVGQMVPQKESHPPPLVEVRADMTTDEMIEVGEMIVHGKGTCTSCHTIGADKPGRFPDLADIGGNAGQRREGYSDVHYLAESLYRPSEYIVEGFLPGMLPVNKPPISLGDDEILTVVAFLQSLGGTPSVTMDTDLHEGTAPPLAPHAGQSATPPAATPAATGTDVADGTADAIGNVAKGRELFILCAACHGKFGQGIAALGAPSMRYQQPWYIVQQLRKFRDGVRGTDPRDASGAMMRPMALALADDQAVQDVAAYIATLKDESLPPTDSSIAAASETSQGKVLFATCQACHGTTGAGNELLNAPALHGQHTWYIMKQLKAFKDGVRGADPKDTIGATMRPMAMTLDEKTMKEIAEYISTLPIPKERKE